MVRVHRGPHQFDGLSITRTECRRVLIIVGMRDMAAERRRIFVHDLASVAPARQRHLPSGQLVAAPGGRLVTILDRGSRRLTVFDHDFESAGDLPLPELPLPGPHGHHERILVNSDLAVVVLTLDSVVCVDPNGGLRWRFGHPQWPSVVGGAGLIFGKRLAVVVPTAPAAAGRFQVNSVELALLDIGTGAELARHTFPDSWKSPQGFHAVARGDGRSGALDAGYGQDGSQIWRLLMDAQGGVQLTAMDTSNRILADISPAGDEILTAPHDTTDLVVYRWDDLVEVARLETGRLFEPPTDDYDSTSDWLDYQAWYLGSDKLLALTRQGRLLVADRARMHIEHQLVVAGFNIVGFDEGGQEVDDPQHAIDFAGDILQVMVIDGDRIVVHGRDGRNELCELSPS